MKIICGTDFSVHANEAALAAAALAARSRGTLSLVHVLNPDCYSKPSKDLMNHLSNNRWTKLNSLTERAKRRAATVEASVVTGSPATKLVELSTEVDAQLLVVSSEGQIGPTQWFAGSVTDQVAQRSSVPTLIIRNAGALTDWAYSKRPLKVVIGYDFSASADAALRWAGSLRAIAPCELTVVYVASATREQARLGIAPPMSPFYYPSGIKKFLKKELKQRCEMVLNGNDVQICVKADWGRPDSHLIEIARENGADLLVVGTSQRRGLARLGSISRAVLHYAQMNVACVPTSLVGQTTSVDYPQFNRVLAPITLTDSDAQTIALAYASVRNGGEVHLVHVVPSTHQNRTSACMSGEGQEAVQSLSSRLESLIPKTAASRGIATRKEIVKHEKPATAICEAAERFEADLICMGSRGRSRLKKAVSGSVSKDVLERSDRAVLVVRSNERKGKVEVKKEEPEECGF